MKFLRAVLVSLSVAAFVSATEPLLADTVLETYAYDAAGRLTNRTDASGSWSFVYDSRDRLKTNTGPVGSLYYKYDVVGNLTNVMSSTPGGTSIDYQYDALNRLTNVVDHRLTGTRNTAYQYDAVGNLATLRYPNGVTNLWQYDARDRLTNVFWKLNTTTNASFAYRLGVEGNRTNLIANLNGWRTNAWGYDQLYRLTSEVIAGTAPTGTISYKYDVVGNRTNRSSTVAGITNHTLAYNTNDWLTIDSYDNNGNTTTSAGVAYQYDYANRLTNANNGGVIIVYNAAGDRISKKVGSTNTLYLVDDRNLTGYTQVLEELTVISGVTNLARAYTYGLDLISQRQPSVSTNFFGYDGLGSTRFLANSGGSLVNRFFEDLNTSMVQRWATLTTAAKNKTKISRMDAYGRVIHVVEPENARY
jgi:YD repeat-containing protein